jgi:hypothetical protein
MKTFLIILAVIILAWTAYGFFSSRVKEPVFKLVEKKDGYDIREYASYIEARVKVKGSYRESQNIGFRILAGYIFGGNTGKQSIAMTAPVVEQKSEPIAMTAPVIEQDIGDGERVVSFTMPAEYTMSTLPVPNDKRIEILEVPAHKSAVLRYSWSVSPERVSSKKTLLLNYLKRDGVQVIGVPRGARYNPPWTLPFMLRNEIIIDIK